MSNIENKYDFSITFWIRVKDNPGWMHESSEVNFPPFTVKNGIKVYFAKIRDQFKVYLLHPELGYRKLKTNINSYLRNDTFIALTNTESETILYINAEIVTKKIKTDFKTDLEVGDYIMAEVRNNEIENLEVESNIDVLLPARIQSISNDNVKLEFFTVGPKTIVAELPKDRIRS